MFIDSRRNISLLASKGHYTLAQEAMNARLRSIAAKKKMREQQLLEEQEIEWEAFQKARDCHMGNAIFSAAMKELRCKEELHGKYSNMCLAHDEEMDTYKRRVEADEARRAVVLPRIVCVLRSREKRLANAGLYIDALRVHDVVEDLTQKEMSADDERRRERVAKRLLGRQKELDARSISSYKNVQTAQQLNCMKLKEEVELTEAKLRHRANEMAATHLNQRRALNTPLFDSRETKKVQDLKASRGTQLQKKICGDHYHIPSLSRLYGDLLNQEKVFVAS